MPDGFTEERKNTMLIQRFILGFHALIFQMGIFSHFALALAGAAGLGLGLAENASAEGLSARTGFAPRQLCTIDGENFEGKDCCSKFDGALQPTPDPRYWACSEIDINDTFCFTGVKTAFPCAGLYQHVQSCNGYNRPALDPFYCAQRCPLGHNAVGAKCFEDRAFSDSGGVYDPTPIPPVASYVGELFRLTATVRNGSAVFVLPDAAPPLSLSVVELGKVAAVHLPRGSNLQGTQRPQSEHLITVQAQFVFRPGNDGKAKDSRTTLRVYTVTALAKRKPVLFFRGSLNFHKSGELPDYGYSGLSYDLAAGSPSVAELSAHRIRLRRIPPGVGTLNAVLRATAPDHFLGALLLTVSWRFDCAPPIFLGQQVRDPDLHEELKNAAALGNLGRFCELIRDGADPSGEGIYQSAFYPQPLPPESAHLIAMLLEHHVSSSKANEAIPLPGQSDYFYHRPIHFLAGRGGEFLPLLRMLVEKGGDVGIMGYEGRTPLMLAAGSAGDDLVFDFILKEVVKDQKFRGYKTIDLRQIGVSLETAEFEAGRLGCPADVSEAVCTENTALHYAAEIGNAYRVRRLVEAGAEVNAKNRHERTPIFLAVLSGNVEAIRTLVEAGAELDLRDTNNGRAPIHYAAELRGEVFCALLSGDSAAEQLALETLVDEDLAHDIAADKPNGEVSDILREIDRGKEVKEACQL